MVDMFSTEEIEELLQLAATNVDSPPVQPIETSKNEHMMNRLSSGHVCSLYDTTSIYVQDYARLPKTFELSQRLNLLPEPIVYDLNATPIREMSFGRTAAEMLLIVVEISELQSTRKDFSVRTARVADPTGSMEMAFWDDLGKCINAGDILYLTHVRTVVFKSKVQLKVAKKGTVTKIGTNCLHFNMKPDYSSVTCELQTLIDEQHGFQDTSTPLPQTEDDLLEDDDDDEGL